MSENNHPCLYCAYPGPHSSINVDERTYFLCLACGAFFQILGENTYKGLTETVYSTGSWGETWQDSIKLHGPRLRSSLDWFHSNEALRPNAKYLDIGAGVGIVEHLMFEMFDTTSLDITAIEPVMENANFLQEKYPEINVIASDIEHITSPSDEDKFDVVICFGVDYLFRDLNKALRRVKDMVRNNGRILIVRAVFLDMPCYWGG